MMARVFKTGATRDSDAEKLDYEGFLSPLVLEAYAKYMHGKRKQPDGLRDSDNWQLGIPLKEYMKSKWRHFMDVWKNHRGLPAADDMETALCADLFNTMGYLHEYLKTKNASEGDKFDLLLADAKARAEGENLDGSPRRETTAFPPVGLKPWPYEGVYPPKKGPEKSPPGSL